MPLRLPKTPIASILSRSYLLNAAKTSRLNQINRRALSNIVRSRTRDPSSTAVTFRVLPSPILHRLPRLPYRELRIIRDLHAGPLPKTQSRAFRWLYRSFAYFGFLIIFSSACIVAFFIYDATTYRSDPSVGELPVSTVALNPQRGGPKNLPIAEHLVDDDDCPQKHNQKHKPKLVILGTGWGSVALLKQLHADEYHVTVVSPSNHFLFTPMLPSATVGTLEFRSLVEPVRRIVTRVNGHFIKGIAEDVDFSEKLVEVSAYGPDGHKRSFYLPYDKLVIGVGMSSRELCRHSELKSNRVRHKSSRRQRPRKLSFPQRHQRRAPDPKFRHS